VTEPELHNVRRVGVSQLHLHVAIAHNLHLRDVTLHGLWVGLTRELLLKQRGEVAFTARTAKQRRSQTQKVPFYHFVTHAYKGRGSGPNRLYSETVALS
jgi:hypothetical protein